MVSHSNCFSHDTVDLIIGACCAFIYICEYNKARSKYLMRTVYISMMELELQFDAFLDSLHFPLSLFENRPWLPFDRRFSPLKPLFCSTLELLCQSDACVVSV